MSDEADKIIDKMLAEANELQILSFLRLLPLLLADLALEKIYALGAKGYGPKRGRRMTLVEARRTYKRRALFRTQARIYLLKARLFFVEVHCFFLRLYERVFVRSDT
ncbi:MAG: hypothetical protein M3436_00815 [Pseudomonadota bacterium]|nr:hypothetical protein [Pseudomonadota bacterium]